MRALNNFEHFFEKVYVINLKRRPERLARFWKTLDKSEWPFLTPSVFSAIEGDKVGVPKFWQTGGGSYGCLRSHLSILERAIQDDVDSIFVLEDDAEFMPNFRHDVTAFLQKVPHDWQCLMFGGQHVNSKPFPVSPGIVRAGAGGGIQRTHCYALRGREIMVALYLTWANAAVHCDWLMGPCTAQFNTYAPEPFIVGQAEGVSDIAGSKNPTKFWRSPSGTEPVVVLRAPRDVMEALQRSGWHGGHNRDSSTGTDHGLLEIFANSLLTSDERTARLKHWIEMIQNEVVSMPEPAICTVWHPSVTAETVRSLVKGKVLEINATSMEEALAQLPEDIYAHKPSSNNSEEISVVILRAPRSVMEVLRGEGWHTGYWRDEVTGQDNGVRRLFTEMTNRDSLVSGLREIVRDLHKEAKQLRRGIATLWHDGITPDMIADNDIIVLEVEATSANEAKLIYERLTTVK